MIPIDSITDKKLLKSNRKSKIFSGILKSSKTEVIIKEIKIKDFRIEEIKILWTLTIKRTIDHKKCKGCDEEVCKNIIKFYGCYEENGNICIVLEKAEDNFHEFQKSSLEKQEIMKYFFEIANALKCVHANFFAHLDFSATNILIVKVGGSYKACLADFGESEILAENNIATNSWKLKNSARYTRVSIINLCICLK